MKKLGFLLGFMLPTILLTGCYSCPCSEKEKSKFKVNDFDSALTAFYNGGNFTCDFSGDFDERFMSGHIAVDENRLSLHANWKDEDSTEDSLAEEGYLFIKNGLSFEWSREDGEEEGEVNEGGIEDIIEILYEIKETIEDATDGTGTTFNIDCKAGIKESDFIIPNGIHFDY